MEPVYAGRSVQRAAWFNRVDGEAVMHGEQPHATIGDFQDHQYAAMHRELYATSPASKKERSGGAVTEGAQAVFAKEMQSLLPCVPLDQTSASQRQT